MPRPAGGRRREAGREDPKVGIVWHVTLSRPAQSVCSNACVAWSQARSNNTDYSSSPISLAPSPAIAPSSSSSAAAASESNPFARRRCHSSNSAIPLAGPRMPVAGLTIVKVARRTEGEVHRVNIKLNRDQTNLSGTTLETKRHEREQAEGGRTDAKCCMPTVLPRPSHSPDLGCATSRA
mgnify:FL=1|jgi:hypothetical protein